ncbi:MULTISPECIES: S41 family peptidase [Sphingobacterium]|uniref:S41 family peptidase n=1 Tax=Sphingobacterium TaxID=28453 RepID=UPI0013DCBA89|nr:MULTISPECIES: S41 family peptidase [unclassified Sphingobacterium]
MSSILLIGLVVVLTITSCNKDHLAPKYPAGTHENINTWILDSLKRYYYWSDHLPSRPDISVDPQTFFITLKNSNDRFSYMVLPNDPSTHTSSSRGKYGFDYAVISEQETGLVFGVVRFVLIDSPASRNGLKRGDYISKINGQEITSANAETLQEELVRASRCSVTIAQRQGNILTEKRTIEITTGFVFQQPAVGKIFQKGSKKIGYVYIYDFNGGTARSLLDDFDLFKTQGITDLILDLRYNPGGQVSEAAGLCGLVSGLAYETPFITYKGNKNGGTNIESIGRTTTFDGTVQYKTILRNSLYLSKVYVLSTASTASASEVIINNLKPYMEVVLIGEKTRGKDEASFVINDRRSPRQVEWEMHPIIYKLADARGNGGYNAGIVPDYIVNELSFLPMPEIGDESDPLIDQALHIISGKATSPQLLGRTSQNRNILTRKVIIDSRRRDADNSTIFTKPR